MEKEEQTAEAAPEKAVPKIGLDVDEEEILDWDYFIPKEDLPPRRNVRVVKGRIVKRSFGKPLPVPDPDADLPEE